MASSLQDQPYSLQSQRVELMLEEIRELEEEEVKELTRAAQEPLIRLARPSRQLIELLQGP